MHQLYVADDSEVHHTEGDAKYPLGRQHIPEKLSIKSSVADYSATEILRRMMLERGLHVDHNKIYHWRKLLCC